MKPMLSTLRALGAALLATACAVGARAEPAPPPPPPASHPNIVFVLVDDLRFDAMGFLNPGLKTPNIDFLARNGVYFPNAVVTSSLCSPSRATILTGMTARNHGVIDNNNSSEAGLTFFPKYLQAAGYQTAFVGKWHMGDANDGPRQGFDRWISFLGQGNYFPTDGLTPQQVAAGQRNMLNVDGKETAQKGYITDELTDYSMDWLEHGRDKSKPFFLYLSHKAVHSDVKAAERYADQYKDLDIKLPTSMADTPENNRGKPMWVRNQRNSWHGVDFFYNQDRPLKDYMREYYRGLSAVDDSVGRILKYLRDNHLEDNTIVVFFSDNGFQFGEHGLIDKRDAYEASIRVPMVAYAPGRFAKGAVIDNRVRNLDLAPTFLDAAGAPRPAQFEGQSVLPLASGKVKPQDWKEQDFVYEYYWEWTFPQTPTTFAIERGRMKYIQYHGVWDLDELYDLAKDPDEMNNLIDDPAYLQAKIELRKALYQQLTNAKGQTVVPFTERTSQGQVFRSLAGAKAAEFPETWLRPANPVDRYNGLFPDSPAKLEAQKQGKPYFPRH
ncbi:sulfatase family protein [Caulobacter sp. RL271]|uniref:Sulfatase n=1 Tax=Caulobacter segnis TaxID=88688 RepID=A0ABY4ZV32_9CAUL|nr:sulfatase [Caulobacter segnis]USQ96585.1 sulfatase [Caulobacter segnis]